MIEQPRFALVLAAGGRHLYAGGEGQLLRSSDGASWTPFAPGPSAQNSPCGLTTDRNGLRVAVEWGGGIQHSDRSPIRQGA